MIKPYYQAEQTKLYHGDCNIIMSTFKESVDMIFADPPYFLSNDGLTIKSGEVVSVNKGDWDRLDDNLSIDEFNLMWIKNAYSILKKNGTIWISGTVHNIYSITHALKELNFKILNLITWQKTNPPPNFTKRSFTHSTEIIIWARKEIKTPHYYNYELMKLLNDGKQMKDVWSLPAIAPWESKQGKHPVQKPLSVLSRIILASTKKGALILDPFSGSGTTGVAANLFERSYIGIDIDSDYLDLSIKRIENLHSSNKDAIKDKIRGIDRLIINEFDT